MKHLRKYNESDNWKDPALFKLLDDIFQELADEHDVDILYDQGNFKYELGWSTAVSIRSEKIQGMSEGRRYFSLDEMKFINTEVSSLMKLITTAMNKLDQEGYSAMCKMELGDVDTFRIELWKNLD